MINFILGLIAGAIVGATLACCSMFSSNISREEEERGREDERK